MCSFFQNKTSIKKLGKCMIQMPRYGEVLSSVTLNVIANVTEEAKGDSGFEKYCRLLITQTNPCVSNFYFHSTCRKCIYS